jgi:hypothetical protein
MNNETGSAQTNRSRGPEEPGLLEVVTALNEELRGIRQQQYFLESRLARYDRAFERMFTEEAETRLRLKDKGERGEMAMSRAPLDQLREQLEKKRAYDAQR